MEEVTEELDTGAILASLADPHAQAEGAQPGEAGRRGSAGFTPAGHPELVRDLLEPPPCRAPRGLLSPEFDLELFAPPGEGPSPRAAEMAPARPQLAVPVGTPIGAGVDSEVTALLKHVDGAAPQPITPDDPTHIIEVRAEDDRFSFGSWFAVLSIVPLVVAGVVTIVAAGWAPVDFAAIDWELVITRILEQSLERRIDLSVAAAAAAVLVVLLVGSRGKLRAT